MSTSEADLRLAIASLAATCEKMCERLLAAEKIIAAVRATPQAPVDIGPKIRQMIVEYDKGKAS